MSNAITVCASCLRASCWQGEFYCDEYKTANTIEKPISELIKLNLESPEYFHIDPDTGCAYRCNPNFNKRKAPR